MAGLPLELDEATVGLLQIEVPWSRILTARVSVTIRDVTCRFHAQLDAEAAAEGEQGERGAMARRRRELPQPRTAAAVAYIPSRR